MATPDLWRVERLIPSKATSTKKPNSVSARTALTGQKL